MTQEQAELAMIHCYPKFCSVLFVKRTDGALRRMVFRLPHLDSIDPQTALAYVTEVGRFGARRRCISTDAVIEFRCGDLILNRGGESGT